MNKNFLRVGLFLVVAGASYFASAADSRVEVPTQTRGTAAPSKGSAKPEAPGRWYGRLGIAGAIYHPAANVSAGGASVPGATATVTNDVTATVDVGYYFRKDSATSLMVGVPPKPTLSGAGSFVWNEWYLAGPELAVVPRDP
jgi:outer membrane protein W